MTAIDTQVITRATLTAGYRISAAYGGPLSGAYSHARNAAAHKVVLDKAADAKAEIDRVAGMYTKLRRFITVTVTVRAGDYQPGQIINITYPRYGLENGVNAFVASVTQDLIKQTSKLTIWC